MSDSLLTPWKYRSRPEYETEPVAGYRLLSSGDTFDSYWTENSHQRIRELQLEGAFFVTDRDQTTTVGPDYTPARGVASGVRAEDANIEYRFLSLKGRSCYAHVDGTAGFIPLCHTGSLDHPWDPGDIGSGEFLTVMFTADHDPPTGLESADTTLSALTLTSPAATLSPNFDSDTYSYTANVTVSSITVTPTTSHVDSTFEIWRNGLFVRSDAGSVSTAQGDIIEIRVTGANKLHEATYTIRITAII